jgi:L-aminopeptidase/D-esterase-like protein
MKGLTDIEGILVGHASDFEGMTGCTAILCPKGATAGLDIRGSATGSSELDLLSPGHLTERIHAIVLSGGSAFGLESASGVRRFLEQQGIGFPTGGGQVVPLVPAAILYDLGIGKRGVRPTREMGEAAAAAATSAVVEEGCVGAGTGATVGKLFGMARAMKSGIGTATVALEGSYEGVLVSAIAAVNALGDVVDPDSGKILAGARTSDDGMEFADSSRQMMRGIVGGFRRTNTTLVAVATNAALSKVQATKLAQQASAGMARVIRPSWTISDGDIVFALSCGDKKSDITALGIAGADAVAQAIVRAVTTARTLAGVPGLSRP